MGTINKAIGFGVGAILTTAAVGTVLKQMHKFPKPTIKRNLPPVNLNSKVIRKLMQEEPKLTISQFKRRYNIK